MGNYRKNKTVIIQLRTYKTRLPVDFLILLFGFCVWSLPLRENVNYGYF